jgi:hypothetical protein
MTLQGKREYYQAVFKRYHNGGRKQRGVILLEFCAATGLNRTQSAFVGPQLFVSGDVTCATVEGGLADCEEPKKGDSLKLNTKVRL